MNHPTGEPPESEDERRATEFAAAYAHMTPHDHARLLGRIAAEGIGTGERPRAVAQEPGRDALSELFRWRDELARSQPISSSQAMTQILAAEEQPMHGVSVLPE